MDEQKLDDQLEPTYNLLFADTGCSFEELPEAMDDREGWCVRVREDPYWRREMRMVKFRLIAHL